MNRGREKAYLFPVVLVFKKSNRKNSPLKLKVYKNKNIDEVIEGIRKGTLPGVPEKAEIVRLGVGSEDFIDTYKNEFNLK